MVHSLCPLLADSAGGTCPVSDRLAVIAAIPDRRDCSRGGIGIGAGRGNAALPVVERALSGGVGEDRRELFLLKMPACCISIPSQNQVSIVLRPGLTISFASVALCTSFTVIPSATSSSTKPSGVT